MSRPVAFALAILVTLVVVGPAAATEGRPDLSVHLPDNRVAPGEEAVLELSLLNRGIISEGGPADEEAHVVTARNTTLTIEAGSAPIEVRTATRPVGNVPEGHTGPIAFAVDVDRAAEPGRYTVPVTIAYDYTSELDTADPDRETETVTVERSVTLVVEPRARFAAVAATTEAAGVEAGDVTVTLEHVGAATAHDARVTLRSEDPALTFGGRESAQAYLGDWPSGERRSVTVEGWFDGVTDNRSVPIVATVEYRDDRGRTHTSEPVVAGLAPGPGPTFVVDGVASTLTVGDEGTVRGTVTNIGPAAVRNAVVILSTDNSNLVPAETEYAVGDLDPGSPTAFTFDVDVSQAAVAGPRLVSFEVRYRDPGDDIRRSDPIDARVDVGPRRPVFDVDPVAATVEAGANSVLELRVANAGEAPVSDVTAKLFPTDPLSSSDDEAFIQHLEPGESVTVQFALAAAPDALDKRYPVSLDFQYDDADGDTRLSDTYRLPVDVTAQARGNGLPALLLVGAIVAVLLVAGAIWYGRRR